MSKPLFIFMSVAALICGCNVPSRPVADLYISPNGCDNATGSIDKPLKTFQGAIEKVREIRKTAADSKKPFEISVGDGTYTISSAISLVSNDSGIHFTAENPGKATISGGKELPPFEKDSSGAWKIALKEDIHFEQLWVNGVRATRARTPNKFYHYMKNPVGERIHPLTGKIKDLDFTSFIAKKNDIELLKSLPYDEITNVYVRIFQSWCQGVSRIEYFEPKEDLIITTPGTGRTFFFWSQYLPRYILENYRAALDAPGEWFHDKKTNILHYIPRPGEDISTSRAIVPTTEKLLTMVADRKKGESLKDVKFKGINFFYAAFNIPNGIKNGQAASAAPSAILCSGAEDFAFESCHFAHVGAHAIWFKDGCRNFSFIHNLVEDSGAGGLYIGETSWSEKTKETSLTSHGTIDNNIIRDGGHLLTAGIGVWIGHASNITLSHNDIGNYRYTGVSSGWTWGYRETANKDIRILYNRIHHIGDGVLNDMGGIYTLGNHHNSLVIGNEIHDVWSYDYTGRGGWGLYTDEGSANLLFESNLVHHVKTGAVHQHYGKDNTFRNNIFAYSLTNMVQHSRKEDHTSFIFENNIVLWDNTSSAVTHRNNDLTKSTTDIKFKNNIYWSTAGITTNSFQLNSFAAWQAHGQDKGSVIADPMLEDPANGKWMPKKDSPAYKCGFKAFDTSKIGVYGCSKWKKEARKPVKEVEFAPIPEKFTHTKYSSSFELPTPNKWLPNLFHGSCAANKGGYIRRVKTKAYTGNYALEFCDSPDLPTRYHPHMYAYLRAKSGTVCVSKMVKGDERTNFQFEYRDYTPGTGSEYQIGPLYHYRKNAIYVHGKKISDVRPGEWVNLVVNIKFNNSNTAPHTWTIDVTPHGGKTITRGPFKCSPHFRELEWIGWLSNAQEKTSLFMDDFKFENRE
jgi:hypothetical protein